MRFFSKLGTLSGNPAENDCNILASTFRLPASGSPPLRFKAWFFGFKVLD